MLKAAREIEGLKQTELAEILKLSTHSDVSRMESEIKSIDLGIFPDLLTALPTLRPARLIEAMGYKLGMPIRETNVPPALVTLCGQMSEEQLHVLLRVARGIALEGQDQPTKRAI